MPSETYITKTLSLKLIPSDEEKQALENYFITFQRAVNFAIDRIVDIRSSFRYLNKNEQFPAVCDCCGKKEKIMYVNISNKTFKFKPSRNQKDRYTKDIYTIKPNAHICKTCYSGVAGNMFIRKQMYPNDKEGWKVSRSYNIKVNAPGLTGTEYAMAIRKAISILRSFEKRRRNAERRIIEYEKSKKEYLELIDDVEKGKTNKIVVLEKEGHQRVKRYKHKNWPEKWQGISLNKAKSKVKDIEKRIKKLKEWKHPTLNRPYVELHKNNVRIVGYETVELKLGNKMYTIHFASISNLRKPFRKQKKKSIEYLKHLLTLALKRNLETYPSIIKRGKNFFLQYPVRVTVKVPKLTKNFKAFGIDRGVNRLAVGCIISKDGKLTNKNIFFFHGKEAWAKENRYKKIRDRLYAMAKKLRGDKTKKIRLYHEIRKKFRHKVKYFRRNYLHNISKQIVEIAKENTPTVIVLEDLRYLRERTYRGKGRSKKAKKTNYKLNTFTYRMLIDMIKYKAEEAGVPVMIIDPRNTSRKCSKCGYVDENNRKQASFKCLKCGYSLNADLNAAVNIAKAFYECPTFRWEEKLHAYVCSEPDK